MKEKYKVAIVGCGRAGSGLHLPACLDMEEIISDVVICDVSKERLDIVASKFGIKRKYTELDKMLKNEEPDISIISTPPQFHKFTLEKCLEYGNHVVIEKPLAPSVDEAEQMIKISQAHPDLKVMVNENYRWFKDSVVVKKFIQEGFIGEPFWVEIKSFEAASCSDPTYSGWLSKSKHQWLYEQGIHWIDLFNYWLGAKPKMVYAQFPSSEKSTYITGRDALSIVNVSYDNGKDALLVQNYLTEGPKEPYIARIEGNAGTIFVKWNADMTDAVVEVYSEKLNSKIIPHLEELPGKKWTKGNEFWSGQQRKVMKYFIECIEQDKEPMTNLKEDVRALKILFAAYRSADEGKIIYVME